jgi:hypothetical protein
MPMTKERSLDYLPTIPGNMVCFFFKFCNAFACMNFMACILGEFTFIPDCCARTTGCRQTVTLHTAADSDPSFIGLPSAKRASNKASSPCVSCNTDQHDDGVVCVYFTLLIYFS